MTDSTDWHHGRAFRSSAGWSQLTSTQRLVALTLSLHMDGQGGSCWPSLSQLAAETGLSYDTVRRALRALERLHLIERRYIHDDPGRGCVVEYWPRVPLGGSADAPASTA